jgi:hypothetical protein
LNNHQSMQKDTSVLLYQSFQDEADKYHAAHHPAIVHCVHSKINKHTFKTVFSINFKKYSAIRYNNYCRIYHQTASAYLVINSAA